MDEFIMNWYVKRYFGLYKAIKHATTEELLEMCDELDGIRHKILEELMTRR